MSSKPLATLFLPLTLAACVDAGDLDDPELGTDESAITDAPTTKVNRDSIQLEFQYGGDYGICTGLALSRHWVITAAHCVENMPTGVWVASSLKLRATNNSNGTSYQIYGINDGYAAARYFRHPAWSGSATDKNDDIAVIRLYGSGINDASYTYRGAVYWDNREPWDTGSGENRLFFVAGYGYGTPIGGTEICPYDGEKDPEPFLYFKRLGMFELDPSLPYYDGNYVAEARTPYQSDICGGDSGAPWLLLRGGRYMTFAVHSGNAPTSENNGYEFGTLVRPKMSWIESTSTTQGVPLVCSNTSAGGYTYRSCGE